MTPKNTIAPEAPINPTKNFGFFVNANGEKYIVHGISPMTIQKIRDDITAKWEQEGKPLPVCPTYEVIIAPGGEEIDRELHEHTDKTLVVEGNQAQTAANQIMWKEYTRKLNEFEGEYSTRLMKKVFLAVDVAPDDIWRGEMEFDGTVLPAKGSAAEKYLYVEQRVIQSVADIAKLMAAVMGLAGIIKPEAVAEAEAAFQRSMESAIAQTGQPESQAG